MIYLAKYQIFLGEIEVISIIFRTFALEREARASAFAA